jgi:hypothetical protein
VRVDGLRRRQNAGRRFAGTRWPAALHGCGRPGTSSSFPGRLTGRIYPRTQGGRVLSMRSAVLAGLAGSALCLTLDGAIGVAQVLEPYLNPDPETAPPAVRPHSVAVLWNWSGMRCIRVCVCVCVFTRMQTIA